MLDHASLPVEDLGASGSFYDGVLGVLGLVRCVEREGAIGYGPRGGAPGFWLLAARAEPGGPAIARPGAGLHLSFRAPSREAVRAFHRRALELGAKDAGAPGVRPHYSGDYYAFVRDPDGYKVEATHRTPSPAAERGPSHDNPLGQPIGLPLADWSLRPRPPRDALEGRLCRLEILDAAAHADALHTAHGADREGRGWTYLPYGPFESASTHRAWIESVQDGDDPLFYAIVERESGRAVGVASYLRIAPEMGAIEVGHIRYSPALQRRPAATEAMFLMMKRVFEELGYRRYEWKCDALNEPSVAAALRLGFRYEGIFRQAAVMKGRNRDTAWFSIVDSEWPALRSAFERWLTPANFDATGLQNARLSDLVAEERDRASPHGA